MDFFLILFFLQYWQFLGLLCRNESVNAEIAHIFSAFYKAFYPKSGQRPVYSVGKLPFTEKVLDMGS